VTRDHELAAEFGRILKAARQDAGIAQRALAYRAGLHVTEISLLERGERTPNLGTIRSLARALDMTMVQLVAEIERALSEREGTP
jgi:transcriptional regulator with XRE-family HTH domain